MASTGVLKALSQVAGQQLQRVLVISAPDLVAPFADALLKEVEEASEAVTLTSLRTTAREAKAGACYLCLAQRRLLFMDRAMRGKASGGMLVEVPYEAIDRIVEDESDSERLRIDFNGSRPSAVPSQLEIRAGGRDGLVRDLSVSWRTFVMATELAVRPFPLERFHLRGANAHRHVGSVTEFTRAPSGERRHTFQGYFLFAPDTFAPYPPGAHNPTGQFAADPSDPFSHPFFEVRVEQPVPVERLLSLGVEDIKTVAEATAASVGSKVETYRVIGTPRRYHKRLNLTGDPAAWDAWETHLRMLHNSISRHDARLVAMRDIAVVALRRKYIPPMMDTSQDLIVVYYGPQMRWYRPEDNFMAIAEGIADSLSSTSPSFSCDKLVVQAKVDALKVDPDSYAWYRSRLRIEPRSLHFAQLFVKSALALLATAGLRFHPHDVFHHLDKEVGEEANNPFEYATMLERDDVGMPDTAGPELREGWRQRAWEYLAWCVDGGLAPGVVRMSDLVRAVFMLTGKPDLRKRLSRLIDTLLYLRGRGRAYNWAPLMQMVSDDRLMRDFEFNVDVMCVLLDSGYIENEVGQSGDPAEYPRFLVRLLRREKNGIRIPRLQYAVCRELVKLSMRDRGLSVSGGSAAKAAERVKREIIIPALVEMMRSHDDNVKVLVTVALVNYTNGNSEVKNVIMQTPAARTAVKFLRHTNMDVVRHAAALLNNLSGRDAEHYRKNVASYGAIPPLVRLLQRSPVPPEYVSVPVLIQAVSVVGNLATNTELRDEITDALGFTERMDKRLRTTMKKHPISVLTLVDLLMEPTFRTEATRNLLLERIVFAMRNLAVKHDSNRQLIGQLCIPELVNLLQGVTSDDLLVSLMQCIYILSFERENCRTLHRERFNVVLDKLESAQYASRIRELARQIRKRYENVGEPLVGE